jgi:hypothetical protein
MDGACGTNEGEEKCEYVIGGKDMEKWRALVNAVMNVQFA